MPVKNPLRVFKPAIWVLRTARSCYIMGCCKYKTIKLLWTFFAPGWVFSLLVLNGNMFAALKDPIRHSLSPETACVWFVTIIVMKMAATNNVLLAVCQSEINMGPNHSQGAVQALIKTARHPQILLYQIETRYNVIFSSMNNSVFFRSQER